MFDVATGAVLFCAVVGIFFLALWLFYDRRDHRWFERERRKSTYHCIRCEHLYAVSDAPEVCACPRCGHPNSRLKF